MSELTKVLKDVSETLGGIGFALFLLVGINACEMGANFSRSTTPMQVRCTP